ncbi:creatininase family protein [Atopobium sp. oral taxon 810]|uniref:creatininase family protein n=1 Tax=Atopobium sp. oral taxon 810 TaxID=712158 RepID=UPI0003976DC5|nr:creatininase family protein [Atopobium sp. oral taxon 810]ERI04102.1 creatininase [Atopobium sp. oral taxon 810 str. F0209]
MNYASLTTQTIGLELHADTPIIFPFGAIEAHGPHLPLDTDIRLANAYSQLLAERIGGLVLPTMPFGQVFSLRDFPGSISVSNDTLSRLIVSVGESLFNNGSRLLILFSSHLGNMTALKDGARALYDLHKDMRVVHMFYPDLQILANEVRQGPSAHHTYIHACEIETSLMLYLDPDAVDMTLAINDEPVLPIDADYTPTPWSTFSQTAVLGDAKFATKEKGEWLVNHTLEKAVQIIQFEQVIINGK